MALWQDCPGGIGNEVTTESECREAARDLRLPLGAPFAGWWGQRGNQRNCLFGANKVWFNYDQRAKAPSRDTLNAAVCRDCAVKNIKNGQTRYQVAAGQNCAGIGTVVTTVEECREAARDVRIPLGHVFAGSWNYVPRNCLVNANKVWFNYAQSYRCTGSGGPCQAVCKIS